MIWLFLVVPALLAALVAPARNAQHWAARRRAAAREARRRPGSLRAVFERGRAALTLGDIRLADRQTLHERRANGLAACAKAIRLELREKLVWLTVAAVVFGAIWIIAVCNEVSIDTTSFVGAGFPGGIAFSLAVLLTLGFSVVGLVLSDVIGLTHLIPTIRRMPKPYLVATAVYCVIALGFGIREMPHLVAERTAVQQAQVNTLTQNIAADNAAGASTLTIQDDQKQLNVAQAQLQTAETVTPIVAEIAAGIEATTSWGAVLLMLLAASSAISMLGAIERRRSQLTARRRAEANQRLWLHMLDEADARDLNPEDELAAPTPELPPAPPLAPQPPGPDAREDEPLDGEASEINTADTPPPDTGNSAATRAQPTRPTPGAPTARGGPHLTGESGGPASLTPVADTASAGPGRVGTQPTPEAPDTDRSAGEPSEAPDFFDL